MCRINIKTGKGQTTYNFVLDFFVFKEGAAYVSYCPSLDLSTCGNTRKEAMAAFKECFTLYVEYEMENGTLHEDLKAHGWRFDNGVKPPTLDILTRKPEIKKLFRSHTNFTRIAAQTSIPSFV